MRTMSSADRQKNLFGRVHALAGGSVRASMYQYATPCNTSPIPAGTKVPNRSPRRECMPRRVRRPNEAGSWARSARRLGTVENPAPPLAGGAAHLLGHDRLGEAIAPFPGSGGIDDHSRIEAAELRLDRLVERARPPA